MLFSVTNSHVGEAPPRITDESAKYVGYFESAGGQSVFLFDDADHARLFMGDSDWNHEIAVVNGIAQGAILDAAEAQWLAACWAAATTLAKQEHMPPNLIA